MIISRYERIWLLRAPDSNPQGVRHWLADAYAENWQVFVDTRRCLPQTPGLIERWHRGRLRYYVLALCLADPEITDRITETRRCLGAYLVPDHRRQPHVTVFVCGFAVQHPEWSDDIEWNLIRSMCEAAIRPGPTVQLEIGGFNSFTSTPFLEVYPDPTLMMARQALTAIRTEPRSMPYLPHVSVGRWSKAHNTSAVVAATEELRNLPRISTCADIQLASYDANDADGPLRFETIC